jgi:XTP/dITP diphosphohydrolase
MPATTLLIATNNPGKLFEFRSLLESLITSMRGSLNLASPADIGLDLEVAETMPSYDGNAALKARAYHHAAIPLLQPSLSLITLADDSGLEVEALGNAPGIHSHRYGSRTGETPLDDAGRRAYLLQQLRSYPQPWHACFHCSLAVFHDGKLHLTHGECRGTIIKHERGRHGFGYDPIFLLSELDKTMAELEVGEKNLLSHRARAVLAALPTIEALVKDG